MWTWFLLGGEESSFLTLNFYSFFFFLLDLQSFITQDPRDRDFLVKNLKSFDVPVLNYMGDEGRAPLPFQLTKEVCDLGPKYVLQLNGPTILSSIFFFYYFLISNHPIIIFFFLIPSRCIRLVSILGLTKFLMLLMLLRRFWLVNLVWIVQ